MNGVEGDLYGLDNLVYQFSSSNNLFLLAPNAGEDDHFLMLNASQETKFLEPTKDGNQYRVPNGGNLEICSEPPGLTVSF